MDIPKIINSQLKDLQFINLGGYPIRTKGLNLLLSVEWPHLVGLDVWNCQIDSLASVNFSNIPKV